MARLSQLKKLLQCREPEQIATGVELVRGLGAEAPWERLLEGVAWVDEGGWQRLKPGRWWTGSGVSARWHEQTLLALIGVSAHPAAVALRAAARRLLVGGVPKTGGPTLFAPAALLPFSGLTELRLENAEALTDLAPLAALEGLRRLSLRAPRGAGAFGGGGVVWPALESLDIEAGLSRAPALVAPQLRRLRLSAFRLDLDVAGSAGLPWAQLEEVDLRVREAALEGLVAPRLQRLKVAAQRVALGPLPALRRLVLTPQKQRGRVEWALAPQPALTHLTVAGGVSKERFDTAIHPVLEEAQLDFVLAPRLTAGPKLQRLSLERGAEVVDLSRAEALELSLPDVGLQGTRGLTLGPGVRLMAPPKGKPDTLRLGSMVERLTGLPASVQELRAQKSRLQDLAGLVAEGSDLRILDLRDCAQLVDVSAVSRLPQLRHLLLSGSAILDEEVPADWRWTIRSESTPKLGGGRNRKIPRRKAPGRSAAEQLKQWSCYASDAQRDRVFALGRRPGPWQADAADAVLGQVEIDRRGRLAPGEELGKRWNERRRKRVMPAAEELLLDAPGTCAEALRGGLAHWKLAGSDVSPARVAQLQALPKLRSLSVLSATEAALEALVPLLPRIERLTLSGKALTDLAGVLPAGGLERLALSGTEGITSLAPLFELERIESLWLNRLIDPQGLARLPLTGLTLYRCGEPDWAAHQAQPLRTLEIHSRKGLDLEGLELLSGLTALTLDTLACDLSRVPAAVTELTVKGAGWLWWSGLRAQPRTMSLEAHQMLRKSTPLAGLWERLTELEELSLETDPGFPLEELAVLPRLKRLRLVRKRLPDLAPLAGCAALERLELPADGDRDVPDTLAGRVVRI